MRDTCWLVFDSKRITRMVKGPRSFGMPAGQPALNAGEYAVLVTVQVPDTVFRPRALPEATITVPESAVTVPAVQVAVVMPPGGGEGEDDER